MEVPVSTGLCEQYPPLVVPAFPPNFVLKTPIFAAPANKAEAKIQAMFTPAVLASSPKEYAHHTREIGVQLTRHEKDVLHVHRRRMRGRVIAQQHRDTRKRARLDIEREIKALETENDALRSRIAALEGGRPKESAPLRVTRGPVIGYFAK